MGERNYIAMKVTGVTVDPKSFVPMVILKDASEQQVLSIWIGILEAAAILSEMEDLRPERPMTHDLITRIIGVFGAGIDGVRVDDLKENVFYATLFLRLPSGEVMEIDSRPSDAIALALRCGVAIEVAEEVIARAKVGEFDAPSMKGKSGEELSAILETLPAEAFGKYRM